MQTTENRSQRSEVSKNQKSAAFVETMARQGATEVRASEKDGATEVKDQRSEVGGWPSAGIMEYWNKNNKQQREGQKNNYHESTNSKNLRSAVRTSVSNDKCQSSNVKGMTNVKIQNRSQRGSCLTAGSCEYSPYSIVPSVHNSSLLILSFGFWISFGIWALVASGAAEGG